jgi:RNA polymerase sigma factor (sigma-70 family)
MRFDDEFEELAALAYRTAFRIAGRRSDAEEIVQDTMIKAYARWSKVRHHARPWVCRVAANEALGVVRKNARRGELRATLDRRAGTDSVDDLHDGAISRLDLQRLLLALPKRQRDVIVLRYLADLTEAQVADELGISVGTVKAHAHRALAALRISVTSEPDTKATLDVPTP